MTKKVTKKLNEDTLESGHFFPGISPHGIGSEFFKLIEALIKEQKSVFSEEEFRDAMKKVLPEIDELISKHIKNHLVELANYILEKMKD